jgi:Putative zinc ribbon domain
MNNNRCKSCGSCGFPMEKPEDFALSNVISLYCGHCTDEKGKLLPYDTILEANTKYYMESQGISQNAALKMAKDLLSTMPVWKSRIESN